MYHEEYIQNLRSKPTSKKLSGRVVSTSGLETSVSSSTPTSAIIYDAYTSNQNDTARTPSIKVTDQKSGVEKM